MKRDPAFHPDGIRKEISGGKEDSSAAIPGSSFDRSVNSLGIVGFAIAFGSKIDHIVKYLFC
jgi:hypothetical protein